MIDIYLKTIKQGNLKKLNEVRRGSWINLEEATRKELKYIAEITELDVQDIHDSLDQYEIPRFERKRGNLIIFLRTPKRSSTELYTETLAVIINPQYFITISAKKNDLVNKIINDEIQFATSQRSKFLIFILTKISIEFTKDVHDIGTQVRKKKSDIRAIDNKEIEVLIKFEEILNQYLATLIPMKNVFENIITGQYINTYAEDNELLQDMLISIKQSVDVCDVNIKSIVSLRDSYSIIFTNNLNRTIKFLTLMTIILTVPMIFSSLYGMNIKLPYEEHGFAFVGILGVSFIISLALLVVFYLKRWL